MFNPLKYEDAGFDKRALAFMALRGNVPRWSRSQISEIALLIPKAGEIKNQFYLDWSAATPVEYSDITASDNDQVNVTWVPERPGTTGFAYNRDIHSWMKNVVVRENPKVRMNGRHYELRASFNCKPRHPRAYREWPKFAEFNGYHTDKVLKAGGVLEKYNERGEQFPKWFLSSSRPAYIRIFSHTGTWALYKDMTPDGYASSNKASFYALMHCTGRMR